MGNPEQTAKVRLVSLDAYRGFIMLAMASAGFYFYQIARKPEYRDSALWKFLVHQFDHVQWTGCGFWDLIQPSFMFMVGVAIPYSYAARKAKGDSEGQIWFHTVLRALILVGLAVFLASTGANRLQTNFVFTNVLGQIGLGYCLVYALRGRGWRVQLGTLAGILAGYWLLFVLYPSDAIAPAAAGITTEWQNEHWLTGLFAHWNKNVNIATRFDQWFLNLFPRETPYVFEAGGYQTLNFVPSMATMIFGLMAGEKLRSDNEPVHKLKWLLWAAAICLAAGAVLDWTVCPSVKRIWTPSWAIYSTGWTFAMLAGFYWIIDIRGYQRWAFPLVLVGMNSIAVYMMSQLLKGWVAEMTRRFLGRHIFEGTYFGLPLFSPDFEPVARSIGFLIFLVLVSWWMYRQKIFVRI